MVTRLETRAPVALDSPDHVVPWGTNDPDLSPKPARISPQAWVYDHWLGSGLQRVIRRLLVGTGIDESDFGLSVVRTFRSAVQAGLKASLKACTSSESKTL